MENNNEIPARSPVSGAGREHRVVETYAEDMAKVIENDKEGLIKKIIHGEEERETEKRNLSPESKKNRLFMLISFILILVSLAIFLFFFLKNEINTVEVEKQPAQIIFIDKSDFIEVGGLNKDKIAQTLRNVINATEVKPGGVEGIHLTIDKRTVGLKEFIALIEGNLTPDVNFVSDNFLLGVVNNTAQLAPPSGKDFFILLKMRSIPDIFDSLHAWENKMFFDLHGFFGVDISAGTNYLLTANFEDAIIENKNARILYDKERNIVLMYVFADDNSVIITDTENAVHEIMLRLAASKLKK